MRGLTTRGLRARAAVGLVAAALPVLALLAPAPSGAAVAADPGPTSGSTASDGSWTGTRTLTREFGTATTPQVVDQRTVTVKVDQTRQLQGRERVHVSWTGAHPSGGRASNPFGDAGLNQEYPVVLLQCRGLDDPSLPAAKQLSPQTCWTSTRIQRSQVTAPGDAIWTRDLDASPADTQVKSGLSPYPADCHDSDPTAYAHVTPFVTAKGQVFEGCTSETMPPEAAVGSSFLPAEQSAFTDLQGNGSAQFEVRSAVENASLGCSSTVACSLVVIPIMGLSCAPRDPAYAAADRNCRRAGSRTPGSSNFANEGVDATVSPAFWWSASNWAHRFSVPLDFGLPPGACDLLDQRPPTAFFGSELLSQAALQWAPAYCLRKDRFKWEADTLPDDAAFDEMTGGDAVAATVSGPHQSSGSDPVAYAPTAVTGFAVSFVVDRPGNEGEVTDLRLDARLLAKLLTESYPASGLGEGHPGIGTNPRSMNLDPEFKALNPGLSDQASEAAATVMSLSVGSDVMRTLTSYIAEDPDAAAFVAGKADPWGMTVNPSYKGLKLPVSQWPLLDTYVPASSLECLKQNPAPYLPQVAAPVSSLRQIASAVLDAWPLVQTKCDRALPTDPWKLGRVDRQGMGTRFLLGITTLGDAARYGLHTASLQAAPGKYVAPTPAGLAAGIALAKATGKAQPFTISQADVRRSSTAYPGTMVVYTAARTHGMPAADAAKVAQFVEVSTHEGQVPGRGNGQLAAGYLPIRSTGVTKPLFDSAQLAASAIRAQKAPAGGGAGGGGGGGGGGAGGAAGGALGGGAAPSGDLGGAGVGSGPSTGAGGTTASAADPVAAGAAKAAKALGAAAAGATTATVTARTEPVSSRLGGVVLQLLLTLALLGGLLGLVGRVVLRLRGAR